MRWAAPLALLWLASARGAALELSRYAVVIGDDEGDVSDVKLRFAEEDARRLGQTLKALGGVPPQNLILLTDVQAGEVRRTLIDVNARVRADGQRVLLLVYYSGHGDDASLHLRGTRFDLTELRGLLAGSPAAARVLIVDACRSGGLTRVKGGHVGPSFEVQLEDHLGAEGLALVASSAVGEDAQESDELGASIFSHYLLSALLGAADANGDGAVTLDEAFAYASERTLSLSSQSLAGPQHPTYRVDLGGRSELVLTWPSQLARRRGRLAFPAPGTYLVRRDGPSGPVVGELLSDRAGASLNLPAGGYFVTQRARDHLLEGALAVVEGGVTDVDPARLRRIDYARVVRKGGTERRLAVGVFAGGGVRGDLLGLGLAPSAELGARLDLPAVTLEARLDYGDSFDESARLGIRTQELAVALDGQRVFDLGPLSIGAGVEVALVDLAQDYHDAQTPNRSAVGVSLGPLVVIQVPVWQGLHLRLAAAAPTYLIQESDPPGAVGLATPFTFRFLAGLGWSL